MKRMFTTLFAILGGFLITSGQTLVTTQPADKNVVLEDYTGIHCQYCPDGDIISTSILDNNPGRVAVISIHQGLMPLPIQVNRITVLHSVIPLKHKPALPVIPWER